MPDRPTHDLTCSVCGGEWWITLPAGYRLRDDEAKARCPFCGGQGVLQEGDDDD